MIVSICRVFVWYLFFYSFLLTLCLLHLRCSSYVFRVFVFELACIDAAVGFCLLHLSYALETSLASFIVVQVSLFLPFFKQLLKTDVHMCLRTCSNCDCNISLSGRQHYHQSVCHLFSILFSNWVCCWKSYLELWPRQRRYAASLPCGSNAVSAGLCSTLLENYTSAILDDLVAKVTTWFAFLSACLFVSGWRAQFSSSYSDLLSIFRLRNQWF